MRLRHLASLALSVSTACSSASAPPRGAAPEQLPADPRGAGEKSAPTSEKPKSLARAGTVTPERPFVPGRDGCHRTKHAFQQPLVLIEDTGIPRHPGVIGMPIAFPRGADLRSLEGFVATTLDGEPLPTQLEVLSRWGDGPGACAAPIRWAYAFVLADVPTSARSYLNLTHDPAVKPEPSSWIDLRETKKEVVVDTGAARFTIEKKRFNGLAMVELREGDRFITVAKIEDPRRQGMLVEHDGALASPVHGELLAFEIERRGPVVATIAAKGTYAHAKKGKKVFRYTVRLSFYAGSASVLFDHTYYNGDTVNLSAEGARNVVASDRVVYKLPLQIGRVVEATARANEKVHRGEPTALVSLQQDKRSPERPAVVYAVRHGADDVEVGTFADRPMLAVASATTYALASIGYLGFRDPQALRFNPETQTLEIDWQSEALQVGGARGIWSRAVLDFGGAAGVDVATRGAQAHALASRPLIAAPSVAYLNTTHAYGRLPEGELPGSYAKLDQDIDRMHLNTTDYLRRYRITGTQIWPDMPRHHCATENSCQLYEEGYFDGGDCNYWDWSLPELEQFLRTADPSFLHDFAVPQAITMAETISFRPDWWTEAGESSFGGFSPCYGTALGFDDRWIEGLNHRARNCPGDYSYNNVHQLAYVLTADRRFTDFFWDGANTAIRQFGKPTDPPDEWFELSAARLSNQYLEPLLTAAEFGRIGGDAQNRKYRDTAIRYFDYMSRRALERGHSCSLLGSGHGSPATKGDCLSHQQWMMPPIVAWVERLYFLYDHEPAKKWLFDYVETSTKQTTVLDGEGLPDFGARRSSSSANAGNGWRTTYACQADKRGVRDETCVKGTDLENEGYYYPSGLLAYLSALALVREVDPGDQTKLCKWLPLAYAEALSELDEATLNAYLWGKLTGQAYSFAQRAVAGLIACP